MASRQSALFSLFLLVVAGIIYGSLYPFRFDGLLAQQSFDSFLTPGGRSNSISDLLGNVVLFFPYGYLACLIARRGEHVLRRGLVLLSLGLLLALLCQLAQLFTLGRDPSLHDVLFNCVGLALGWLIGGRFPLGSSGHILGGNPEYHLPLVIAGSWIISQLLPLVPALDLQSWKNALKPLLLYPHFYWQGFLFHCVAWLACLFLLERQAQIALSGRLLILAALVFFSLQVLIVEVHLTLSYTSAMLAALAIWWYRPAGLTAPLLGGALLFVFALDMIAPFVYRQQPLDFRWLPFEGYLHGSMLVNARALCRKAFIFGAIVLLFVDGRQRPGLWLLAIAAVLLSLEILQRWLGYGWPALTDPLLFVVIGWLILRYRSEHRHA